MIDILKTKMAVLALVLLFGNLHAQDCEPYAGPDTLICGFEYQLVGSPADGIWSFLCDLPHSGVVLLDSVAPGISNVTVSNCGTYFFGYTISDSLCTVTDTVQVDFEDPSTTDYFLDTQISLEYEPYECHSPPPAVCTNTVSVDGHAPPKPKWTICTNGSCQHLDYNAVYTSQDDCHADSLAILIDTLGGSASNCWMGGQEEVIVVQDGDVVDNDLLDQISEIYNQTLDDLLAECPPVLSCIPIEIPPECLDTLIDTLIYEIPVRLGGQWSCIHGADTILLNDTTTLWYNGDDFVFIISPGADYYGPGPLDFTVFEIDGNNNWTGLTVPFSIVMLWQENWIIDTLVRYSERVVVKDSCEIFSCGGNRIWNSGSGMPGPPQFDCEPFQLDFQPPLQADVTEFCISETDYIVVIQISGGIPPYTVDGIPGTLNGSTFESTPIPIDQSYSVIIDDEAAACPPVEWAGGPHCECLGPPQIFASGSFCPYEDLIISTTTGGEQSTIFQDGTLVGFDEVTVNLPPGTYTFSAISTYGFCASDPAFFTVEIFDDFADGYFEYEKNEFCTSEANPVPTYEIWAGDGHFFFSTGNLPVDPSSGMIDLSQAEEGDYTIFMEIYTACNAAVLSQDITISHLEGDAGPDQTLDCDHPTVELKATAAASSGDVQYEWNGPGGFYSTEAEVLVSLPGTYLLTIWSGVCALTDTVLVNGNNVSPIADAGPQTPLDCGPVEAVVLGGATSSTGPDIVYQWSGPGISDQNENELNPLVNQEGTYTLIVLNTDTGCSDTSSVSINFPEAITAEVESGISCEEEGTGSITVISTGGGTPAYLYALDNGNFQTDPYFENLEAGSYDLVIQDSEGCEITLEATIEAAPRLNASIEPEWHICGHSAVTIDAGSSVTDSYGEVHFQWSNGSTEPIVTINQAGTYQVSISDDCHQLVEEVVVIDDFPELESSIFVPNIFTPNGDEINDIFKPFIPYEVSNYEFWIFDRWGSTVYASTDINEGWDGRLKKRDNIISVYVYWLRFTVETCAGSHTYFKKGDVTLVR